MNSFRFATDSDSGTVVADSLQSAYASLRAKITPAMIADGATLWVEDEAGNRLRSSMSDSEIKRHALVEVTAQNVRNQHAIDAAKIAADAAKKPAPKAASHYTINGVVVSARAIRMARHAMSLPQGGWPETQQAYQQLSDEMPSGLTVMQLEEWVRQQDRK